jgi:hypothetical protein
MNMRLQVPLSLLVVQLGIERNICLEYAVAQPCNCASIGSDQD